MIFTSPLKPKANELADTIKSFDAIVVCFCAQWCRTCVEFYDAFEKLSQERKELFLWVDIEEDPELLDDLDVEDFPTILIQKNGSNIFYGTMLPHILHLKRMLENDQGHTNSGPSDIKMLVQELLSS